MILKNFRIDTAMNTKFASPERSSSDEIDQSNIGLEKIAYLNDIFCSLSYIFCILNENRQIVFSNDVLLKKLGIEDPRKILGLRFGEAIQCINASEEEAGCGTSEHCRYCGAVNTMLSCQKTGEKTTGECRLRTLVDEVENFIDVEVTATPFDFDGQKYMIFSLIDISDRKRRAMIERIFFHDIQNAAGGLKGFFDMFERMDDDMREKYIRIGASMSQQILDEIAAQRLLIQAENKELQLNTSAVDVFDFISQLADDLQFIDVANGKRIVVDDLSVRASCTTDAVLLRRVLTNMIKNALEASTPGQQVTIRAELIEDRVKLSVHNPKFIPREIEMQIFMRSFSTKGAQRGLGTYSMKILGEQMLGAEVGFTTSEMEGTRFFIVL